MASMSNESFHRLRSNIFEVCVCCSNAHTHSSPRISTPPRSRAARNARAVNEALVCARSVSVDSAAMETIGVISMAADLALGPGARN